jgi:mRNA interferase MazF
MATRGDVVRVELPPPAGNPGREQFGERPAIVVQDDARLQTVVLVPLTSNAERMRLPGSVLIQPSKANGLSVDSVALCSQVRAIDRKRVLRAMGRLADADYARIEDALRQTMGL